MFKCERCDKEFETKQGINRHLSRKILCDHIIRCDYCLKEFKTNQQLTNHNNRKIKCKKISIEEKNKKLKNENILLIDKNDILEERNNNKNEEIRNLKDKIKNLEEIKNDDLEEENKKLNEEIKILKVNNNDKLKNLEDENKILNNKIKKLEKESIIIQPNSDTKIKSGHLYVASNIRYEIRDIYKIGKTINIKSRIHGYNSGYLKKDSFQYVYYVETDYPKELETLAFRYLKKHHVEKEIYNIKLSKLKIIIDLLNTNLTNEKKLLNII